MANQYTSRGGVAVQAHVVDDAERELQVRIDGGNDRLGIGDALVNLKGKEYVLRAGLFAALFGPATAIDAEADEPPAKGKDDAPAKGKGGQHEAAGAAGAKR